MSILSILFICGTQKEYFDLNNVIKINMIHYDFNVNFYSIFLNIIKN
jgi:hypothetical protein